MVIKYTTYRLECIHPFKISRSSFNYYDRIFIYLDQDGIIGRGEAAPSEHYSESVPQILEILRTVLELPAIVENIDDAIRIIDKYSNGIKSLRSALICAYLDWYTQKNKTNISNYFQFSDQIVNPTSFTIGLSDPKEIEKKINEASDYNILKVKLGTYDDKDIINYIRQYTEKPIRVDANEGWDLDTAKFMCEWLSKQNIELVEQPLLASKLNKMEELRNVSPLPIIADENCINSDDVSKLVGKFDGINIKLSKCGGLEEAARMIKLAKEYNLKVMLGCMLESSIGITALSHLAAGADYLDLDGNLLTRNDPYSGVLINNGIPKLPNRRGLGVLLKDEYRKQNLELK